MQKKSSYKLTRALVLLVALYTGCGYAARMSDNLVGSGNRKTETRDLKDFTEITVNGAYKVEVACGQEGRSVEIEADDNLLPYIKTDLQGATLNITQERGLSFTSLPRVRISVPDLKVVRTDGASDFELVGLKNDVFRINVDGASKFRASGETGTLDVELNGAARIDASQLRASTVNVESNGAGLTTVHATETLNATVNGVGSIEYYGDPKVVNPKVNGIGRVSKK